ncbi:uncharacterized protein LY89DRAFT_682004 [Mollisia scopiformis]|uniref:Nuclear pore complex protein n=1 Tax=Mollisia scopiformis TaxID=149040 RepID=A0A194XJD8_MOLSC|nr:uncharacterized protein LY89DRAFT_682004 [Mollisia scopiformis]KUJ20234.1 hypothetical protein LY89DRAFT_682004 [Mollisia scopiformis]
MAPMMTRSNALVSLSDDLPPPPQQRFREASWQFVAPQSRSDRELSEEPPSSYDEDADVGSRAEEEDYDYENQPPLTSPDDHEDILHPLREAANRVGREVERFAEVLDAYNPKRTIIDDERREMMFDLIELYHGVAKDTVQRLEKSHATEIRKVARQSRKKVSSFAAPTTDDKMDVEDSEQGSPYSQQQTSLTDLERWKQEEQTWDLLRRLVQLRFPSPDSVATTAGHKRVHQYSTQRDIWEHFLETDKLALERKTVLQWLEATAENNREDITELVKDLQQNADRGEITAHGWIHTKAAIKKQKIHNSSSGPLDPTSAPRDLFNLAGTEPLVTQLDPDATTRQRRRLEIQDEHFERSIWLACYEMLRRGWDSRRIRETCEEYTEIWRAISMSGFPDQTSQNEDISGNADATALWRRMCFTLAHNGGGDDYERAVYGILSGDISSVEPVCDSWDDFVFAHYNALLRAQFDSYLEQVQPRNNKPVGSSHTGVFDAVQFYGDPLSAGKRLVSHLQTHPRTSEETVQPMKMLQGVLIANDFSNFIYQQGLALSKFANAKGVSSLIPPNRNQPENEDFTKYIALDDHDSLRVLTHVLLIFMGLGLDLGGVFRETEVENVIVAYISFLRLAGKEELIPLYSSQLSGQRRYAILCRNLIDVTDHEQRVTQIKLMRELGLDVQEFVGLQARFLLSDYEDTVSSFPASGNFKLFDDSPVPKGTHRRVRKDFFGEDPDKIDRVDMLLIRSLEWYLLVDGLWKQTFTVGTMLYLRFFKHMHLNAARKLAVRVSAAMICQIKTRAILGDSYDFESLELGDDEDLTEVLDGSADQKRLLRKHLLDEAKNYRELENLIECLDNIETVASMECLINEQSDVNTWQKSWRQQLAAALKPTKFTVQPLLKGWLTTFQNENLAADLRRLREAYLPETLLAYITTLQFAGQHLSRDFLLECMDFATMVADEDSDLLSVFMSTGQMQELVETLAFSSKNLLLATSQKPGSSKSKKLRMKGWTHDLWSVKKEDLNERGIAEH